MFFLKKINRLAMKLVSVDSQFQELIDQVFNGWLELLIANDIENVIDEHVPEDFSFNGYLLFSFETNTNWRVYVSASKELSFFMGDGEGNQAVSPPPFYNTLFSSREELKKQIIDYYKKRIFPNQAELIELKQYRNKKRSEIIEILESYADGKLGFVETGVIFQP